MGRLHGVTVDIEGASMLAKFEVIKIVDDNNPYPVLLGIDWVIDMNGVINLKKQTMLFESKLLRVVVPLDRVEGPRYTELVCDYEENDDDLDQICKLTARDQDWINPTIDGWIAWDCESSYTLDLDEELEHSQNRLHEVSTLCCKMMTKSLRHVSSKVSNLPYYDGLIDVDKFLDAFERKVPGDHRFQALDLVLCAMPARWWGTHKDNFDEWHDYKRMTRLSFGRPKIQLTEKYDGRNDPRDHLAKFTKVYGTEPQPEWVHLFCYSLDIIPMNWYLETELRHDTAEWDILREGFLMTFSFENGFERIDEAL